ncbi:MULTISPECIES: hypothetical protein [unclassified Lactococcus]|uniref:hypothetical protein n=1 Tax=unclassified Lactococcus TaxID=2643510 RepID=UPI0011CCD899|nr:MULTISPECIES: hypothetical protein [unclassified Lactococcus]MQW22292.1 hypothetical protein [Lactococcus sp. dk101]TXK45221.1 hypothetical protein FVP42_03145 [Lactococcus sp. dk310]TXK51001.1 hypothetical protein FVP43_01950 [Lactococcus sp. dk322]
MKKTPLLLATALILIGITSIKAHADTVSGMTGTGYASVTFTAGSLSFVQVPDLDFGAHQITSTSGLTGLTQPVSVTSDLIVDDYRGLPEAGPDAGYYVTASVKNGDVGFVGTTRSLTTSDVSMNLGTLANSNLAGVAATGLDKGTSKIAVGTAGLALGELRTDGGTASISIANSSVYVDTYKATINYTLTAGI